MLSLREPPRDLFARQAGNFKRLDSGCGAGSDPDVAPRHVERLGERGDYGVVGGAVDWRRIDADDHAAVADTVNRGARRTRNNSNLNATQASIPKTQDPRHKTDPPIYRRPKIAVPTLTIVAPSSIATS
jgi:hypothetical protein